jgi:phage baseplate assembly protein V
MSTQRMMERMLGPLGRRLQNVLARGTVALVDATKRMQSLQVKLLADETLDGIEHFEPYGFTSHPHPGAEVLTLSVDGDRSHTVVIVAADRRYRMEILEAGEVALHDDGSSSIVLRRGGIIEITAETEIRMVSPLLTHNGVNVGDIHKHSGVRSGQETTGVPQ